MNSKAKLFCNLSLVLLISSQAMTAQACWRSRVSGVKNFFVDKVELLQEKVEAGRDPVVYTPRELSPSYQTASRAQIPAPRTNANIVVSDNNRSTLNLANSTNSNSNNKKVIGQWAKPNSTSNEDWNEILASVKRTSRETGIPEQLIMSLIQTESAFNPRAISRSGAIGLTQLMPETAAHECGLQASELFEIDKNISCGIGYLDKQFRYFKKIDLAVAAYHAGPGTVRRAISSNGSDDINVIASSLKPETEGYVRSILGRINYGRDFI